MWTLIFFLPALTALIIPRRFLRYTILCYIALGAVIAVAIFVYFLVANPQPQEGGSVVGGIIFPIIVIFGFGLGMIVSLIKAGILALMNGRAGQEPLDDSAANR